MAVRPEDLPYTLVDRTERVGPHAVRLSCLDSFEATMGRMFAGLGREVSSREREDLSPMFGVIWGSARALAARVAARDLRQRRVLELGCGLALPSLVAAARGAEVLATDQHPHVPFLLAKNAARNGVSVDHARIDWREAPPPHLLEDGFDLVIASDVLFARENAGWVAGTFAAWLRPGAEGILVDPGRSYLQEFVDEAEHLGLQPGVEIDRVAHEGGVEDLFVVLLRQA